MIYLLLSYNKHNKFNKILLKVVVLSSAAIISRWDDTNIIESLDIDSQVVIKGQL